MADLDELLARAKIKSSMLRMCEPIAFGSDADVIDELSAAIASLREALKPFADGILPCDDCVGKWKFGTVPKVADYIRAREALSPTQKPGTGQ